MRQIVFLICVLSGFAIAVPAQDCTQTLPLNVVDQQTGNAVTPLQLEAFHARMGEVAIRITAISPVERRRVLVLVDTSGSMAPKNNVGSHQKEALEVTEQTLTELLKELPRGVSIAYGLFNDKAVFTEGFFSDFKQLQQAIAETRQKLEKQDEGGTALFDALQQATGRFETPQPGDTIVLLSDGGENKSKTTEGKFEKEMRRSGVRVALLFVNQRSTDYAAPFVPTIIELAHETGGAVGIIDISDMSWASKKEGSSNREALRRFWTQQILNGYLMQVQTPATLVKPRKWKLTIGAKNNAELKHVTIQYPAKLAPCAVSKAAVH
jgi:hypothetical protein